MAVRIRPTLSGSIRRAAAAITVVAGAACSDTFLSSPSGPTENPAAALDIVQLPASAPATERDVVTFYARRGASREGRVYFGDGHGGRGTEYLRLTIDKNSLAAQPDGTPFAVGDSVLITIRVADPARILFTMEPAGLRFSDAAPAELRISYGVTAGDLDHNGKNDSADDDEETHLAIWRQANPGAAFVRLDSRVSRGGKTVVADLPGFSRYAIAY